MSDTHGHAGAHAGHFNELDPHGAQGGHGGHHGHVIMSAFVLRAVLIVLLAFTALTVGAAQLEQFVVNEFGIHLPRWVNIAVALSIATVKSVLVLMFFMQLKYDNPLNTVVFLFTLLAFGLFLGFTMLDLGYRDTVYKYKAQQIVAGGMGNIARTVDGQADSVPGKTSIASHVRQRKIELVGAEEFARLEHKAHSKKHGHAAHDDHAEGAHSAQRSRPRTGTTPGLFESSAPAGDHGDAHGAAPHGDQPVEKH